MNAVCTRMALGRLCLCYSLAWLAGCSGGSRSAEWDGASRIREGQFLEFPGKLLYVHRRDGPTLRKVTLYEWEQGRLARENYCNIATVVRESREEGLIIDMPQTVAHEAGPKGVRRRRFDLSRRIVLLMPEALRDRYESVQPRHQAQ